MGKGKGKPAPRRNKRNGSYAVRTTDSVDALLQEAFKSGFQKAFDLLALTLHDKEVMGTDLYGEGRIYKVYMGILKQDDKYWKAWTDDKEADYLQDDLDRELRAIFARRHADKVASFKERHPLVFMPGYDKTRRGWL